MEIKKQLIIAGSSSVNAVLLNDEGEEYPVFLESLHNTIIFPSLIQSGYSLASLPYGFIKNGVMLEDLPVENYACDTKALEIMYNSTGVKLPMEEIRKHVNASEARGLPLPETNYTIFTREDLLKYLDATAAASLDEDFMPLNYFVHPDACFTLEEYKDLANHKYIDLIDKRREMSLQKFHRLVAALQAINLGPNPTTQDVLDAYFAWGMDGLKFNVMNRRQEQRAFRLSLNRSVNVPFTRRTFGLLDGAGNQLTPDNERDVVWRLVGEKEMDIRQVTSGMRSDDTTLVEYIAPAKQVVTVLEGPKYNIQYTSDLLIMQCQSYPSLRVKSPIKVGEFLDLRYALPNNVDLLREHCLIDALAEYLYSMRKPGVRVSSYDALRNAGCNPSLALLYVVTANGLGKKDNISADGSPLPYISDREVDAYLNGGKYVLSGLDMPEDARDFLDDVIKGVYNIDEIAVGKNLEGTVSTETVYREIYAIHHILGVSLEEIYEKFKTVDNSVRVLTFSGRGLNYRMETAPLVYSINGYTRDIQNYDFQNARDCTFFSYVIRVAREVGIESANRHVGLELYFVNKKYDDVKTVLTSLREDYLQKLSTYVKDDRQRVRDEKLVDMFALSRFFEIALKGTITYPTNLGGQTVPAMPSTIQICRNRLERRIESTLSFCRFTANTNSARTLTFNGYCVNAYITPEYVIPRGNNKIPEAPFYTLWCNWKQTNPAVHAQLVANGCIPADFVAWESRYATEQFEKRSMFELEEPNSLLYYYKHALEEVEEYPDDKEFVSVKHPMEYLNPGLYSEEDTYIPLPTLRTQKPVVRLGVTRNIGLDDYRNKLMPSQAIEELDSYIKPLRGFNVDMLFNVSNIFSKIPSDKDCTVTVMPSSESIYLSDTGEVRNFRDIVHLDSNRYPICHVYDRYYIIRGANGKLWEARV